MKPTEQISREKILEMKEVFNTSPDRLFKAWTNEKDFTAWYGPEGFEVIFCKLDVRVGGNWRAGILSAVNGEYWMEGKYIEIIEGERLVFTYNDGSENKNPDFETIVTINFIKSGEQTIMDFKQTPFPSEEIKASHNGGWSGAFNCLKSYLKTSV